MPDRRLAPIHQKPAPHARAGPVVRARPSPARPDIVHRVAQAFQMNEARERRGSRI